MVADHFVDDEAQEFLAELGVEVGLRCERAEPGDLGGLARRICRGEPGARLVRADLLRCF